MNQSISKTAIASALVAFIGVVVFILSGYGYQWGWWGLGAAFQILIPGGAVLGIVGLFLGVWYVLFYRKRYRGGWPAFTGILLGIVLIGNVAYWYFEAQKYPPIHDITTDTDNPPVFDAIVPLRAEAPNPTEYGGEEVANIQKEHYPDIGTLYLQVPPARGYQRALETARETGWDIVSTDTSALKIEATHTLAWFGFKDDIVIRVDTTDTGSKIDVRSVSRIGRGDIGVNAERIREYLERIE